MFDVGATAKSWVREGNQWQGPNVAPEQAAAGFPFATNDRLLIDERSGGVYFWATFIPKKLGGGSFYLMVLRDSTGELFDGASSYRLSVPPDTPAGDFWSVIAYSMETKGFRCALTAGDVRRTSCSIAKPANKPRRSSCNVPTRTRVTFVSQTCYRSPPAGGAIREISAKVIGSR